MSTTLSGTYASRPAAGNAGNLYFCTDCPYLFRDNGVSWDRYGLLNTLSPPNDALFSWVNQGPSTVTTVNGAVRLDCFQNQPNADVFRGRFKAIPATPYTITMGYLPLMKTDGYKDYGLCLRESSTGKFIFFGTQILNNNPDGYYNTIVLTAASPTGAFVGNLKTLQYARCFPWWLRITDDGTTITFYWGVDAYNFIFHYSAPRTTFLLTGADQYGYMMDPYGQDCSMIIIHLKEN